MTRDDIIKMAKEACLYVGRNISGVQLVGSSYEEGGLLVHLAVEELERFAGLVRAAERRACEEACEEVESRAEELWDKFAYPEDQGMASGARQCATAIRARGNT